MLLVINTWLSQTIHKYVLKSTPRRQIRLQMSINIQTTVFQNVQKKTVTICIFLMCSGFVFSPLKQIM